MNQLQTLVSQICVYASPSWKQYGYPQEEIDAAVNRALLPLRLQGFKDEVIAGAINDLAAQLKAVGWPFVTATVSAGKLVIGGVAY